jgi:hypothetical protein
LPGGRGRAAACALRSRHAAWHAWRACVRALASARANEQACVRARRQRVSAPMWEERARSRRRCGQGRTSVPHSGARLSPACAARLGRPQPDARWHAVRPPLGVPLEHR